MSLSVKGVAAAGAVLIGITVFLAGLVNLVWPSYGAALLELAASIYPGYSGPSDFASVIVVTLYGLLDGAIGGAIVAWVYNAVARRAAAPA